METRVFGYARVSSRDQNVERQVIALRASGVQEGNIFIDRQSGKDFARPAYRRMCRVARPGDVIKIASVDRLGRCYTEVVEHWRYLTQKKMLILRVLDMPILNTNQERDLTQKFISDLVLYMLSYVAEMERAFIRQRQKEGIAAARQRGVKFGAPRKHPPLMLDDVLKLWCAKLISEREAARRLGVSRATVRRWAAESQISG